MFKLKITHSNGHGVENTIEMENSEPFADQKELLRFLRPLIQEQVEEPDPIYINAEVAGKLAEVKNDLLLFDEQQQEEERQLQKEQEEKRLWEEMQEAQAEQKKQKAREAEKKAQEVSAFYKGEVPTGEPPSKRSKQLPLVGTEHSTFTIGEMLQNAQAEAEAKEADPEPPRTEAEEPAVNSAVIAAIHCPNCGLETAKQVRLKAQFTPCPTCKTRLFLWPINDHKPGDFGQTYRANSVYLTVRERWEQQHGKA